jgi:ATP-binding cassette, subfamily B, bacterial
VTLEQGPADKSTWRDRVRNRVIRPVRRTLFRRVVPYWLRMRIRSRHAEGPLALSKDQASKEKVQLAVSIPIRRYTVASIRYALPYWWLLVGSGLTVVLTTFFTLLTPWPLQFLLDYVLGHHHAPHILLVLTGPFAHNRYALAVLAALLGFVITLGAHGLAVIDNYITTKLQQHMILDFRADIFQHVQRLSMRYHDTKRAGDFMNRINQGSMSVGFIPNVLPGLLQSLFTLVGMIWVAFLLDKELTIVAMIVVPFLSLSTRVYSKWVMPQVVAAARMEGESNAIVHEAVSMIRVMRAFAREDYEYKRFRAQGEQAVGMRVMVTIKQTLFSLGVNGITAAGSAIVLALGAFHVIDGRLTVGELLVLVNYLQAIYQPMQQISTTVSTVQAQYVGLHRCFQILDEEPEVVDSPDAVDVKDIAGAITYEGVSFKYTNREPTLTDVSFHVSRGKSIAIVGPTGAGKSTLVSLLPRFYDPDEGRILLDGRDIRDITLRSLREQISIVLQEPLLFSGSILDNIRYGRLEADMEEVFAAARAANAHDFIEALPDGYETLLGERGSQLSGGERQRISVARAFMKDAPILILDEPTSSVDTRTEAGILQALARLMEGRTTFIIAHRLSTVRHADTIVVLDHGRVVEQGRHEELIALGGLYASLHNRQAGVSHREQQVDPLAVRPAQAS